MKYVFDLNENYVGHYDLLIAYDFMKYFYKQTRLSCGNAIKRRMLLNDTISHLNENRLCFGLAYVILTIRELDICYCNHKPGGIQFSLHISHLPDMFALYIAHSRWYGLVGFHSCNMLIGPWDPFC